MLTTLRGVGLTFLLFASTGPAFALDQSAIEETSCLMACDANQEHCLSTGQVSTRKSQSFEQSSPRELKSSPAIGSRRPTRLSEAHQGVLAHPRAGKR